MDVVQQQGPHGLRRSRVPPGHQRQRPDRHYKGTSEVQEDEPSLPLYVSILYQATNSDNLLLLRGLTLAISLLTICTADSPFFAKSGKMPYHDLAVQSQHLEKTSHHCCVTPMQVSGQHLLQSVDTDALCPNCRDKHERLDVDSRLAILMRSPLMRPGSRGQGECRVDKTPSQGPIATYITSVPSRWPGEGGAN